MTLKHMAHNDAKYTSYLLKVSGPHGQTFCIEKDSYMDAI